MFNRLGGLASPSGFLSPSLLAFSLESCIRVHLSIYALFFLLLAWVTFPRYDNVCFTFLAPCWAIPLGHWQCLFYFPTLCDRIVHDVYISIYACIWVIVHFVWWTFVATWATLSSHECFWPCSMGMCPRHLLQVHSHTILCAQSLRCDHLDPCHQVTLIFPCMRHASICLML